MGNWAVELGVDLIRCQIWVFCSVDVSGFRLVLVRVSGKFSAVVNFW